MSIYLVSRTVEDIITEAKEQQHKNLFLNYQQLETLPNELLELDRVEKIYLKYNILDKVPRDIWRLTSLTELYLHSNKLEELPEEIGQLKHLKSLNIASNYLKFIPSSIGCLSNLEHLHLSNNDLKWLPESLGDLHALRVLDVINNDIAVLPWQLCYCCNLDTLLVDDNRIRWLPPQLTKLKYLKELSASRNKLICIPQDIDEMVLLENLLLDSNIDLCALPATVLRLENLMMVGLNQCGDQSYTETSCLDLSKCFQNITFVGNSSVTVCPLLELGLRKVHKLINSSWQPSDCIIPSNLDALLRSPTGQCFHCKQFFFTGMFGFVTDVKAACRVTRSTLDINTKLPIAFAVCSYNCLSIIDGLFRDMA